MWMECPWSSLGKYCDDPGNFLSSNQYLLLFVATLLHFYNFTLSHFHTLTISQFHTFTSPQLVYASDIFPSSSSIPGSWLGFAAVPRGDRSSACVVNLYWFEKVMTLNYIISIDPDLWRNRKLFPRLIDLAAPPVLFAANNKEKASGLFAGHGQDKLQVFKTDTDIYLI